MLQKIFLNIQARVRKRLMNSIKNFKKRFSFVKIKKFMLQIRVCILVYQKIILEPQRYYYLVNHVHVFFCNLNMLLKHILIQLKILMPIFL